MNKPLPLITSIVELPHFHCCTVLNGQMYADTHDRTEYAPFAMELYQGRMLEIPPLMSKYKLEIFYDGTTYELVVITREPVDLVTFKPKHFMYDDAVEYYPIFIKSGMQCLLLVDSINRLFKDSGMVCSSSPGTDEVLSPMEFISSFDRSVHAVPFPTDNLHDFRYSYMARFHSIPEIVMSKVMNKGVGDQLPFEDNLDTTYAIFSGVIPHEVEMLMYLGDFRRFKAYRPVMHYPSEIEQMVAESQKNWDELENYFRNNYGLPDFVGETMLNELEDFSFTGRMLSMIYTQFACSDFTFPVETKDAYETFSIKKYDLHGLVEPVNFKCCGQHSIQDYLVSAFLLNGKFPNRQLIAHKSYLEDIIIHDATTNQPLLYIDLVYWALACSDGLINRNVIDRLLQLNQ